MKISDIDKNFKNQSLDRDDVEFFNVRSAPFRIYGLYKPENEGKFLRCPMEVAKATNGGVEYLCTDTAGGRVRFKTDSGFIAIKAVMKSLRVMSHMAASGSSGFDMYCDGSYAGTFRPSIEWDDSISEIKFECGVEGIINFQDKKMRDIIINFPLYNAVDEVFVGIEDGAELLPGDEYRDMLPIVYYGSSITQGGCASRPGNSYEAILSRWFDVDYINLGFSGSARGEDAIADYIADLPMSMFVYDYDHNAPTVEHLRDTHYRMYKKIRDKNPEIPIIMASRPNKNDGGHVQERIEVIEETLNRAISEGDKNIYFVNGQDMVNMLDWDIMTVDGCHPNDFGFYCMAKAFAKVIEDVISK